jgi:hypothetical protein
VNIDICQIQEYYLGKTAIDQIKEASGLKGLVLVSCGVALMHQTAYAKAVETINL